MTDIDRMSRQVPHLCKVAPSTQKYHMEDVHRAGGVMGILGELQRAGLLKDQTRTVLGISLQEQLAQYDVKQTQDPAVHTMFRAGPAGIRTTQAFSQDCRWDTLDDDRQEGCIRDKAHAFSQDGGLAVLKGNLAIDGCIVKTLAWMKVSSNSVVLPWCMKVRKMRSTAFLVAKSKRVMS